jgi:hypothetical protein
MNEIEICTTAIETNVRTLIKTHPDSKQFIETLRNEAIDQAFREISERIDAILFRQEEINIRVLSYITAQSKKKE